MKRSMENMEISDSRKRPLDGDFESGVSKKSNQGLGNCVHLKILVPSVAAGAIIGKGGETITQIQKEKGAVIKMSKANDFYPGTTERVCLMTGSLESVKSVHEFILSKIREKPDPSPKTVDGDLKVNLERHKQVKILVPNSTAGMIIGKGGNYIRQIKDESGAYVQISQKSKDLNLPERCVTIAGDEEQNKKAIDMILQKIVEDPQSGSCPNISYADVQGPVASSNPTGSPFANNTANGNFNGGNFMGSPNMNSNIAGLNNLNLNSGGRMGVSGGGGGSAMDNLKATLRGSGYTEQAVEEISAAMYTLANYGLLGMGFGLNNQGGVNLGGTTGLGGLALGNQLSNLGSLLTGGNNNGNGGGGGLLGGAGGGGGGNMGGSMFGPVGSGPSGMSGDGSNNSSLFGNASHGMAGGEQYAAGGDSMFDGSYGAGYNGPNQNSFGLGTGMGGFSPGDDKSGTNKKELEVPENIVGAILGPGGKGIVELQQFTGANIQISKKGVYAPGTRNRVVTITGNPNSVSRANYLIQQRINQEEAKRARQAVAR